MGCSLSRAVVVVVVVVVDRQTDRQTEQSRAEAESSFAVTQFHSSTVPVPVLFFKKEMESLFFQKKGKINPVICFDDPLPAPVRNSGGEANPPQGSEEH